MQLNKHMLSARHHVRASPTASAPRPASVVPRKLVKVLPVLTRSQISDDDSESMAKDNWEAGEQPQEVVFTEKDIQEGNTQGSSAQQQPTGTELGQVAEERSSGSGSSGGGGGAQEVTQSSSTTGADGGRFDEEPVMGDHPYDPRPRERGHGVPPHKDASNTGAAQAGQD